MATENFKKLLEDFSKVHIPKREKTFMGICQYPASRFEEICSRVLAFYFNPNEEHGLRDLWFRALNQCIKQDGEYCKPKNVNLLLEEPTCCVEGNENKKIDIIIEADNTVYAIENKIGAPLYNDLNVYSEHIERKYVENYPNKKKIVLTAHSLSPLDKQKVGDCGYEEISYKTLFEQVNAILGDYIADSNVKQLTFMIDFMKTINNKMNFMGNTELANFFFEHREEVDNLIYHYNEWKNDIAKQKSDAISVLYNEMKEKTKDNWEIYQGWDLRISFNDGTDKNIGIEANFEEDNKNACAKFKIFITTWGNHNESLKRWKPYKNAIMEKYSDCYLDEGETEGGNGRVYLHIAEIDGSNYDEIIEKLSECYTLLKSLADKVTKEQ